MKILFALFFLLISFLSLAQVKDVVPGSYGIGTKTVKNYIKNPYCFANTKDIVASDGASVTKTFSPLEGESSCAISSSGAGGKVKFSARALDPIRKNGQCLISFAYSGDGTKWKGYVESNSVKLSNEITLIDSGSDPKDENYISYSCGDLSSPTYFVLEALGTAPVLKLSSVSLTKDYLLNNQASQIPMTSYGPITLTPSVSGVITKGPRSYDDGSCGSIGNRVKCILKYQQTAAGSGGVGAFLITIPNNHSVKNVVPSTLPAYNSGINSGNLRLHPSIIGSCNFQPGTAMTASRGIAVTLNATQFYCIAGHPNSEVDTVWGSAYGGITSATSSMYAEIEFEDASLSASVPTYSGKCSDPRKCEIDLSFSFNNAGTILTQRFGPAFPIATSCTPSSGGVQSCTYSTAIGLTEAMDCNPSVILSGAGAVNARITASSSTGFTLEKYSTTALSDTGSISVKCSKQNTDALSSMILQQIVSLKNYSKTVVPNNLSGSDDFSFSFGATATTGCTSGTCAYLDQIGDHVLSVVYNSTGLYTVNFNKTYSKIKCSWGGGGSGSSSNILADPLSCSSCSSMPLRTVTYAGSASNTFATISCKGMY